MHRHTADCWVDYTPCGEHHRHSFNCGGGKLRDTCPEYEKDRRYRINMATKRVVEVLRRYNKDVALVALEQAKKRYA